MTATNKQLLISESCGDSNRCTPCIGKPDQRATRFPRLVHVWSKTIRISHGPHIATFRTVINRFERVHCPWEEGLPTQSTAHRLTDLWVHTQLLYHNNQWSSGEKLSFCWHPTTRLTRPISPTCNQYIQYLLTGADLLVLNRHRRGLQPWRCRLTTYHSPTFPTSYLHFPLRAPPGLQFNQFPSTIQGIEFKEPMTTTWSSDHSTIYRSLHLCLAIANDLFLVKGVTRIGQKVKVMELGTNLISMT
jgi:hypothetical protein